MSIADTAENLTRASQVMLTLVAASGGFGVLYLVWVLRRALTGRPMVRRPLEAGPIAPWPWHQSIAIMLLWLVLQIAFVLFITIPVIKSWLSALQYPSLISPVSFAFWALYVVLVMALIRPYGPRGRDALGLTTRGAGRSVREGSTAYLLLVGPCVVLLWLTVLIMDSFELKPVLPAVFSEIADQPWWVFALAVARLGIVVPFFEEFFFRGVIQGTMMRAVSPRQAIFLASMVFALAHIGQPQGIPSIFLLSLGLGYVYCRCRSLVAPFVLHSLFNIGFLAMKWTDS